MLIEIEHISKRFGGLQALHEVSLMAQSSEVTAVIGPNGAGKSTLLDCLTGLTPPDSGHLKVDGRRFDIPKPGSLIEAGITRSFQHIRLFPSLTIVEHIDIARRGFLSSRRGRRSGSNQGTRAVCHELLARVGLAGKWNLRPAELSYGERRRLELARGLATDPQLLLVDEPAAGSNPSEQLQLAQLITDVARSGVAIILVEHHMDFIANVSTRVVVLSFGRVIATGTIEEIRRIPEVISVYLGSTSE